MCGRALPAAAMQHTPGQRGAVHAAQRRTVQGPPAASTTLARAVRTAADGTPPEAVHVDKYASRRVQHLWHLLRRVSKWQRYARWHSRDGAHFERRFIDDDGGRRRSRLSGERLRRKVQKYPAMLWVHQLTAWSVSAEEAAVRTVQQRVRRPALERAYLSA